MADDREKNNQLVKAKTSSLQKRASNIVSRGLADLALLDVEKAEIADEQAHDQWLKVYSTANTFYRNGQYDRAIEDYNKLIALDPNDASAYRMRGRAYRNKGQYDRAIEDCNKVIALDPNDAAAYTNRGNAYYNKGQYDRAIEDYNKAIQLDPNLAQDEAAYSKKGQDDKANDVLRLRIRYYLISYLRRMEWEKKTPTFDEIVLFILPLLKNGVTPENQTVLNVLEDIGERVGKDGWRLKQTGQASLFI